MRGRIGWVGVPLLVILLVGVLIGLEARTSAAWASPGAPDPGRWRQSFSHLSDDTLDAFAPGPAATGIAVLSGGDVVVVGRVGSGIARAGFPSQRDLRRLEQSIGVCVGAVGLEPTTASL